MMFVSKTDIDPTQGRYVHHRSTSLAMGWLCQHTCMLGFPHNDANFHGYHAEVKTFPGLARMEQLLELYRQELFYASTLDSMNSDHYAAIYKQYSDALQEVQALMAQQ